MRVVSDGFKESCDKDLICSNFLIDVSVSKSGGALCTLTNDDLVLESCTISGDSTSSSNFSIGGVCSSELKLTLTKSGVNKMKTTGCFSKNYCLHITQYNYVGDDIGNAFNYDLDSNNWSACSLGYYYISKIENHDYDCDITAYDGMIIFDKKISASELKYMRENSKTIDEWAEYFCSKLSNTFFNIGFEHDGSVLNNNQSVILSDDSEVQTYREALGYLSVIVCGFATFNQLGNLVFRTFKTSEIEDSIGNKRLLSGKFDSNPSYINSFSSSIAGFDYSISQSSTKNDYNKIDIAVSENPFLRGLQDYDKTELNTFIVGILDLMSENLFGVEFYASEIDIVQRPYLELGDSVTVERVVVDENGDTSYVVVNNIIIMSYDYTFCSSMNIRSLGSVSDSTSTSSGKYTSEAKVSDSSEEPTGVTDERVDTLIEKTTGTTTRLKHVSIPIVLSSSEDGGINKRKIGIHLEAEASHGSINSITRDYANSNSFVVLSGSLPNVDSSLVKNLKLRIYKPGNLLEQTNEFLVETNLTNAPNEYICSTEGSVSSAEYLESSNSINDGISGKINSNVESYYKDWTSGAQYRRCEFQAKYYNYLTYGDTSINILDTEISVDSSIMNDDDYFVDFDLSSKVDSVFADINNLSGSINRSVTEECYFYGKMTYSYKYEEKDWVEGSILSDTDQNLYGLLSLDSLKETSFSFPHIYRYGFCLKGSNYPSWYTRTWIKSSSKAYIEYDIEETIEYTKDISGVSDKINNTEEKTEELSEDISAIQSELITVKNSLKSVKSSVASLESDIDETNTNIDNINLQINSINTGVASISNDLDNTKSLVAENKTNLDNLQNEVDNLPNYSESISELNNTVINLEKRLSEAEESIKEFQSGGGGSGGNLSILNYYNNDNISFSTEETELLNIGFIFDANVAPLLLFSMIADFKDNSSVLIKITYDEKVVVFSPKYTVSAGYNTLSFQNSLSVSESEVQHNLKISAISSSSAEVLKLDLNLNIIASNIKFSGDNTWTGLYELSDDVSNLEVNYNIELKGFSESIEVS